MTTEEPVVAELAPREIGFVARIMSKYPAGQDTGSPLTRSVVIFSVMVLAFHVIEMLMPSNWVGYVLGFVIVYPPAVWMFVRYRKFSIFRSRILSKVGARLAQYEDLTPPSGAGGHPGRRKPGAGLSHPHAGR